MLRSALRPVVAVASIAAAPGCAPERAVYADRPFCATPVPLTASAGPAPTFSWPGGCRVWALRVEDAGSRAVLWSTGKDDESLDGPVTYGRAPAGASVGGAAEPLHVGRSYRGVLVQRSEGGRVLAEITFSP
jgi:hypothetical protein